jgi:peptidoglycan/LPS O-acetylase OafA/YrhL
LLLLLFKTKNAMMTWTLWAIAISSFALAVILTDVNPQANFYLLQTRAWELMARALIAIHAIPSNRISKHYKTVLSLAGLVMILTAILVLPSVIPHPSYRTLLPVLGTVLVLTYAQNTPVRLLLSNRVLVGIGLISYPLYFWHQPIFAFVRIKSIGEPGELAFAFAIVLTITMANLSFRYIETPFRARLKVPARRVWIYSAFGLSIFTAIGLSTYMIQGMPKPLQVRHLLLPMKQAQKGSNVTLVLSIYSLSKTAASSLQKLRRNRQ